MSPLIALSALALVVGARPVRAAHRAVPTGRDMSASAPALGAVTSVSIVPAQGHAEVVVGVRGAVDVQDFTLASPHRLVVDISGVRLGMTGALYDKVTRAGITNVRLSQYRADVVRLVLDLDSPADYSVVRADDDVRITLSSDASFAAWHSTPTAAVARATDATAEKLADAVAIEPAAATPASPRTAEPAKRIEGGKPGTASGSTVFGRAPRPVADRITVTWIDADIKDVLAGFAGISHRTIVVGKSVNGTVSAEVKDQPWDVAMQAILQAQGLAANEEPSGIITVDSYQNLLQKQASEPLTTQLVTINYASALSLVGTIKDLLSKDCPQGTITTANKDGTTSTAPAGGQCVTRGSVSADTATNTLLVTEVSSRLPDLLSYVRDLDVRTPQVALKAKIIAVNRTQTEQLGLSYDLGSRGTFFNTLLPRVGDDGQQPKFESQVELGGEVIAGVANAKRKFQSSAALNLVFSTALGKYSLSSFLDALKEENLADLQAEPSIVTLDNREAEILVGQETPVRVIDAGSAGQIGAPVRATVQFKETGIRLKVTPHITNNRQVRMTIAAEQSRLNIVGGDLGFITDKTQAQNQLLVNDGETAVIGGLTQTQVSRNRSGIPFLSDLPLIGRLFSQSSSVEEKKDLLILITPHILDEGEAVRPPGGNR